MTKGEDEPAEEPVSVEAVARGVYRSRDAVSVPQSLRVKIQEQVRERMRLARASQGRLI